MLRSYLTITFRNLLKHKAFSLINIGGLSIGLSGCLLVLQYVGFESSYDQLVPQKEQIYRLITHDDARDNAFALTSLVIAPILENELPEVAMATRLFPQGGTVSVDGEHETKAFKEEQTLYADAHFLKIFGYPAKHGIASSALEAPGSVALTVSAAERFFGRSDESVIGKQLTRYDMFGQQQYQVTALLENLPPNAHIQAEIFFSFHMLESEALKGWGLEGWNAFPTYVMLHNQAAIEEAEGKLPALAKKYGQEDDHIHYSFQPLAEIYLDAQQWGNALGPTGSPQQIYSFTILAYVILLIGWINYINLTTARSAERIKEVGLRKIMGGSRRILIKQFLTETFVLHLISLVIAITIFQGALPFLSNLLDKDIRQGIVFLQSAYGPLLLLVLFTGTMLSGLYPAILLSSFAPGLVLKGKFTTSNPGIMLRKGLVVMQFVASIFLLGSTLINYLQLEFMQQANLGLTTDQILVLDGPTIGESLTSERMLSIKNELAKLPFVSALSSSGSIPGKGYNYYTSAQQPNQDWQQANSYAIVEIDAFFLPNYEITLLAGRNFSQALHTEKDNIVINKTAMQRLGFASAEQTIGQQIRVGNAERLQEIIGVVDDYHHASLKEAFSPIIFNYQTQGGALSLKLSSTSSLSLSEIMDQIKTRFLTLAPGNPFTYFFLDEHYASLYQQEIQEGTLLTIFSCIAIIIACMGLYGLTSLTVQQRTKEIGIRKVLGATVLGMIHLLTQDFIGLILLAATIAVPLVYFTMHQWLENYAFTMDYSIYLFTPVVLMIAGLGLATVGWQAYKAAQANPANSLRNE
uniref:ABC transporter permease n=1 Tax=Roseihalotalea indica TaxID=2867963 RepID=A0AA49JBA9_9BACT|nr:ABC transporter permease [Tunicatimonas sp. TK19036]